MLRNARNTAFTVFELLREDQQWVNVALFTVALFKVALF